MNDNHSWNATFAAHYRIHSAINFHAILVIPVMSIISCISQFSKEKLLPESNFSYRHGCFIRNFCKIHNKFNHNYMHFLYTHRKVRESILWNVCSGVVLQIFSCNHRNVTLNFTTYYSHIKIALFHLHNRRFRCIDELSEVWNRSEMKCKHPQSNR